MHTHINTHLAAVQLVGVVQLGQPLSSELITAVNDPPACEVVVVVLKGEVGVEWGRGGAQIQVERV